MSYPPPPDYNEPPPYAPPPPPDDFDDDSSSCDEEEHILTNAIPLVKEVPIREPDLNAVPKKSALKKTVQTRPVVIIRNPEKIRLVLCEWKAIVFFLLAAKGLAHFRLRLVFDLYLAKGAKITASKSIYLLNGLCEI